jgi:hypothetical protein
MLNSRKGNCEILYAEQNKCHWRKKRKKRGGRNVTCILIAVIIKYFLNLEAFFIINLIKILHLTIIKKIQLGTEYLI